MLNNSSGTFGYPINTSNYVHITGDETISGDKTINTLTTTTASNVILVNNPSGLIQKTSYHLWSYGTPTSQLSIPYNGSAIELAALRPYNIYSVSGVITVIKTGIYHAWVHVDLSNLKLSSTFANSTVEAYFSRNNDDTNKYAWQYYRVPAWGVTLQVPFFHMHTTLFLNAGDTIRCKFFRSNTSALTSYGGQYLCVTLLSAT